ncbi:hypothetical protein QQY66_05300 [Streptomyces sp. DG2A-72]|uniref:hypothetical protein n=1 Tax=Streptomyces sp. DG2A-72 TaxID=3051386 RepID=UPI00265C60BF|nr:hypothetical protein [Streptomyces sp. DG2A-72]MDO0931124.1 hypothetical protein [Streptomyces sp. DG2A-72]
MAKTLAAPHAARLTELAARRRGDGSRGLRARRAWRQLVRACAAGDPAALEAVRAAAGDLPEPDVLDLLAVGPQEPAGRAAYLTLLGQREQRQAMDPDGALLALAYRAAEPDVRERLRRAMAAAGETDVIRVVVTGDRRDRMAEMTDDELDYLAHELAEHRRWDELRRLALDLPLAKATATARVLPADERGALLTTLAEISPEQLAATIERLPRKSVISCAGGSGRPASFSPDQAELAVAAPQTLPGMPASTALPIPTELMETVRLATGESTVHVLDGQPERGPANGVLMPGMKATSILHLGDELYRMDALLWRRNDGDAITRVHPAGGTLPLARPEVMSGMGRASTGVVAVTTAGLVFFDRGLFRPRYVSVPRITEEAGALPRRRLPELVKCWIATLPESRLIAISTYGWILMVDEQGTVLHHEHGGAIAMSFLGPDALAFITMPEDDEPLKVQLLSASHGMPRDAGHPSYQGAFDRIQTLATGSRGDAAFRKAFEGRREHPLDAHFASVLYSLGHPQDLPPVAVSAYGDMIVTSAQAPGKPESSAPGGLEVHSPHLPSARELLEQPLLHTGPHDVRRIRELRPKIGDPAVREALDLLARALEDRFGADIALGTGPVSPGGPHDIALGADGTE